MFWSSWNRADKTLFATAVIFVAALFLLLVYPTNLFARGFLACADAALVGGIADWFAVTALFRKPLGFSWHTALLPRRREAFVEASVTLVQREIFSRQKLFQALKNIDLAARLLDVLRDKTLQEKIVATSLHYMRCYVGHIDFKQQTKALAAKIRLELAQKEPAEIFTLLGQWLRDKEQDHALVGKLSKFLSQKVAAPEFTQKVESLLTSYVEENTKGTLSSLFLNIGKSTNVLNIPDIMTLVRQQALEDLSELAKKDSPLQQKILALCYEKAEELSKDADFLAFFRKILDELLQGLPLEEAIEKSITLFQKHFFMTQHTKKLDTVSFMLHEKITAVMVEELQRVLVLIGKDAKIKSALKQLLYDMAARLALKAQEIIAVVVRDALARLTDEQLNHLVYDKLEPDLLWIRMNGSIVGAALGLIIFVLLQLVH